MFPGGVSPEAEQAEEDEVGEEKRGEGWSAVDEVGEGVDGWAGEIRAGVKEEIGRAHV